MSYLPNNFSVTYAKGSLTKHPEGQLRIGNESLGLNPYFFYDQNDQIITLRQLQSGHLDTGSTFYTDNIPQGDYSDKTWANATIEYAKDGGFNTLRIHMFIGATSPTLFPSRRVVNSSEFVNLLNHLDDLKNNNLYFVLDGFLTHPSWWLGEEFVAGGGLFWNKTVQDDFIWIWNATLNEIKYNSSAWDNLVYLEPWSEYLTTFNSPTSVMFQSRDPFRYNGEGSYGNSSLVSWNNWLKNKFNNDDIKLQNEFNEGTNDNWGMNGEVAFFNVSMPENIWSLGSVRQYYFSLWYLDCLKNFTSYVNSELKEHHPDLYFAWDGFSGDMGAGGRLENDDIEHTHLITMNVSDIIDFHIFGSIGTGYTNWDGDRFTYTFQKMAAIARSLNKPILIGEHGIDNSADIGYSIENDFANIANWRTTLNVLLATGCAGWTPYWTSYWHAYETGKNPRITRADFRRPYINEMNKLWESSELWIDKLKFNEKVAVYYSLGNIYRKNDISAIWRPFQSGGYNPKYLITGYSNETIFPETIPDEVELIFYGVDYYGSYFSHENDLINIDNWLNSNNSHKLVIFCVINSNLYHDPLRYEDYLNTTIFPLTNTIYGDTYIMTNNNTDTYIDVDGYNLLLNRSEDSNGRRYSNWVDANITGTRLINETFTGLPYVIINDRVAWVSGSARQWYGSASISQYGYEQNIWLLYKKILEYYDIPPIISATIDTRASYSLSVIDDKYAIATLGNLNYTSDIDITPKFDLTYHGMDSSVDYSIFNLLNETRETMNDTQLSSGVSIHLPNSTSNIIVLRNTTNPSYVYSSSYLLNETWFSTNNTLKLEFIGYKDDKDNVYVYWDEPPYENAQIKYINGTIVDFEDYYDSDNKLLKIPIKFSSIVTVYIYGGESGGFNSKINKVTNAFSVNGINTTNISYINKLQ